MVEGKKIWALLLGAAAIFLFAAAVWTAVTLGSLQGALTAGVIAVGGLQAFLLMTARPAKGRRDETHRLSAAANRLRQDMDTLIARVDALEAPQRAAPAQSAPPHPNADLIDEVKSLRQSIQSFASVAAKPVARDPALDRLELLLEPVVALATGETVHYRASLSLAAADGHRVAGETLLREAGRNGLRTSLDVFAASRAAPAIARIRARRQEARIFVPVGPQSLASPGHLAAIAESLREHRGAAGGIVFEIDHADMASLDPAGVEGLARLAQSGSAFALARANPSGIELGSLRDLRFQYLFFEAMTLPQSPNVPPIWSGLARFAHQQGFAVVVANAAKDVEAEAAANWAEYGCGPAFAPPRLVRNDLDAPAPARRAA
jgi:EAL domain-containing protein (putative c-di-GMP-specific phosphodiesterase class I)